MSDGLGDPTPTPSSRPDPTIAICAAAPASESIVRSVVKLGDRVGLERALAPAAPTAAGSPPVTPRPSDARVSRRATSRRGSALTADRIADLAQRHAVIYFPAPCAPLLEDLDASEVRRQPIVVNVADLAYRLTAAELGESGALARELLVWSVLAETLIFESEYVRDEVVRRHGIPRERTQVIHPPLAVPDGERPDARTIERTTRRLGLPATYIVSDGFEEPQKNSLTVLQALKVLRWRRFDLPPVVLLRARGHSDPRETLSDAYGAAVRAFIADEELRPGRDIVVLDGVDEADVPALHAGSSANVSVGRAERGLCSFIAASMFYGAPVIASAIPHTTERIGGGDQYALVVPTDDPVALADAIVHVLETPSETRARCARAHAFVEKHTAERAAAQYHDALERVAASR